MFVDHVLARRLERTEGMVSASFVEARSALGPGTAAWREIGGAIAICDGTASPLTQTFALGMDAPATAPELAALEAFFAAHGAPAQHEVCPYAGVATTAALVARGYAPIEISSVMVRAIGEVAPPRLHVRAIDPHRDGPAWVATSIAGWADPAIAEFIRALAEVNLANRAMTHYLVELDGAPIATGSLGLHDGVALLAGASTIPAARGRGAQAALLAQRLIDARARGAELAMIVADVGSQSQRNAQRNGFAVAYTRTKWRADSAQTA